MEIGDYIMRGVNAGANVLASGILQNAQLRQIRERAGQEDRTRREMADKEHALLSRRVAADEKRADAYARWMNHNTFLSDFDRGFDLVPGWVQQRQVPPTPAAPSPMAPLSAPTAGPAATVAPAAPVRPVAPVGRVVDPGPPDASVLSRRPTPAQTPRQRARALRATDTAY